MAEFSRSRWRQLESHFHRAVELGEEERAAYLEAEISDPELRAELERLLSGDDSPDPVAAAIDDLAEIPGQAQAQRRRDSEEPPERLGPYRLIEKIGQGGLGSVFLAERDDGQFERLVAVKIVRRDLVSAQWLEDFRLERQLLARLEHPHIARLYDGGTGPGERPYLAMEYVDGSPIDRRADVLGLDGRLDLFQQVASAVSHAHANLVIHRDLKPSNILVTEAGIAKLLDFGIARPLPRDSEEPPEPGSLSLKGLPRRRLFTPEFASPEQIAGEPLGTATDVYSLGVLLYRLLTGRLPFHLPTDADPESWSARRSRLTMAPASEAAADENLPWAKKLRGDLEAILDKALAESPPLRYASVRELEEDLQRFREHRPIRARPAGKLHRSSLFLRRHRLAASAAAAIFLAVSTGFGATIWSLHRAEQARARAEAHLVDLSRERDRFERLIESFVDIFRLADPGYAGGEATITAQELIDTGVERLLAPELADAELTPYLTTTFAEIYLHVGSPAQAESLLTAGLEIAEAQLPSDHFILWRHRDLLADSLLDQGRVEQAVANLERAQRLHLMEVGHDGETLARLVHTRGVASLHDEEAEAAAALFRQALRLQEKAAYKSGLENSAEFGTDNEADFEIEERIGARAEPTMPVEDRFSAESRHRLAQALVKSGDLATAEAGLQSVLDFRREHLGEKHPSFLTALGDLAAIALFRHENEEAAELLGRVLAGQRSIFGPHHPHVAVALQNLAVAEQRLGNHQKALDRRLESVAVRRRIHGEEHPAVADALYGLARAYHQVGELDVAEPVYRQALDIRRRVLGESHPAAAMALLGLADLNWSRGRLERAAELYREVIARLEATGRGEAFDTSFAYFQLGSTLLLQGRKEEARPWLERARDTRQRHLGKDHPATRAVEAKLAELG